MQPGGRRVAAAADGDAVLLDQLQVHEQAKRVGALVDRDVGGVLLGELLGGHLGVGLLGGRHDLVLGSRRLDLRPDRLLQLVLLQRDARLARRRDQAVGARLDARVDRLAVDLGGDVVDEGVDRVLRVGDPGLDVDVDLGAPHVAADPVDDRALAALGDRVVDHAVDVGALVELLGAKRVGLAGEGDLDRLLERGHDLFLDDVAGLVGAAAADVDAADADPRRDPVLLGVVVRVDADRKEQRGGDRHDNGDHQLVGCSQAGFHGFPAVEFYEPRRRAGRVLCETQRVLRLLRPGLRRAGGFGSLAPG